METQWTRMTANEAAEIMRHIKHRPVYVKRSIRAR